MTPDGKRVVCIVPARGSDRVPYLNIKRLGDRPLLAHTLEAAQGAKSVDRLVVSTDDERIAAVARECGAEVPFIRPRALAGDIPSLKPVISHAVAELEKDGERAETIVVLQPSSPFRDAAAVDDAVAKLVEGGFDSVISVTEDRTLNWRAREGCLVPLFEREGRREEQVPVYKENGAVVAIRREVLDDEARFGDRVGFLVLDKRAAFTVHDLEDFWMAERLLRQPRILFRVDGGPTIGMGHVYRSLAIADALRELSRADIAFLMSAEHSEGLVTVSQAGYAVRAAGDGRLDTYLEHVRDYAPAILVNDLPALEGEYLRALAHVGATTVNLVDTLDDIDDVERTERYAEVIVSVMSTDRETAEGFYGGPRYAILRRHFHGAQKEIRTDPKLVLLTFGGSDPQGLTIKAARALEDLPQAVDVLAVAGPAFSYRHEFEQLQARLKRRVQLIHEAGGHIADLMQEADVVLCSGGMSVYEIAALGTPGVVLTQNAREDSRMHDFARHGTIEYLGLGTDVAEAQLRSSLVSLLGDTQRRRRMSEQGRALVDGLGASRAAEMVLEKARSEKQTTNEVGE